MISDLFWRYEKSKNLYSKRVVKKGADEAIVFLHGLGGSRNYWDESYAEVFSKDRSVYFVDLLGFGFSAKPPGKDRYTTMQHVYAVREFIRRNVKEQNIVLVGHSLGAIIALAYARTYPEGIKRMFLLALPYYKSEEEAIRIIKSSMHFSFLYINTFFAHISCMIMCSIRPLVRAVADKFPDDLPNEVMRDAFLHTHSSYFSTFENVILKQSIPEFLNGGIKDKIVVAHGARDTTVPLGNIKDLCGKYGLRLIELENADHNFPLNAKEQVMEVMRKVL